MDGSSPEGGFSGPIDKPEKNTAPKAEVVKNPFSQFMEEEAKSDKTKIVGGEIISPTARLVGETDDKLAKERGWLSGITSARADGRFQDVQELVNEAKKAGISTEVLRKQLESLGFKVAEAQKHTDQAEQVDPELILPSGKKVSWIRYGGGFYDNKLEGNGDFHLGVADSENMASILSRPRMQHGEIGGDETVNSWGIHIPPEIEREARLAEKNQEVDEKGIPITYADYVGKKMGWISDGAGGWTIPADQIEKLTNKQATIMAKSKNKV